MKNITFIILLLFSLILTNSVFGNTAGIGSRCRTGMFTDDTFKEQTDHISIYERIYLLVQCKDLPVGSYTISTQWMDEKGKLHAERNHSFQLTSQQDYAAGFKFKQMMQGTLNRTFSGQDFEKHQFGSVVGVNVH